MMLASERERKKLYNANISTFTRSCTSNGENGCLSLPALLVSHLPVICHACSTEPLDPIAQERVKLMNLAKLSIKVIMVTKESDAGCLCASEVMNIPEFF